LHPLHPSLFIYDTGKGFKFLKKIDTVEKETLLNIDSPSFNIEYKCSRAQLEIKNW